jgi:hypothetical protein
VRLGDALQPVQLALGGGKFFLHPGLLCQCRFERPVVARPLLPGKLRFLERGAVLLQAADGFVDFLLLA